MDGPGPGPGCGSELGQLLPGILVRGRRGSGWVKNEVGTRSRREDENWGIWLDVIVVVPPGISNPARVGPLPGTAQRASSTPSPIKFTTVPWLQGGIAKSSAEQEYLQVLRVSSWRHTYGQSALQLLRSPVLIQTMPGLGDGLQAVAKDSQMLGMRNQSH